jgi:hypothetical protein
MHKPETTVATRSILSDFNDSLAWFGINVILVIALAAILWSPAVIFYTAFALVPVMFVVLVRITLNPTA